MKAGDFFDIMTKYIYHSLVHGSRGEVPFGLDPVDNIKDSIKQTKAGIELGMHLLTNYLYDERFNWLLSTQDLPSEEPEYLLTL